MKLTVFFFFSGGLLAIVVVAGCPLLANCKASMNKMGFKMSIELAGPVTKHTVLRIKCRLGLGGWAGGWGAHLGFEGLIRQVSQWMQDHTC